VRLKRALAALAHFARCLGRRVRATAGVLERTTGGYLCPITATGGQAGGFIVNEIVPLLAVTTAN
jgi:hypothetical protein